MSQKQISILLQYFVLNVIKSVGFSQTFSKNVALFIPLLLFLLSAVVSKSVSSTESFPQRRNRVIIFSCVTTPFPWQRASLASQQAVSRSFLNTVRPAHVAEEESVPATDDL